MMKSFSPYSVRHVPQRTCLACRQIKAKQELVRLVRISEEKVEVDISGKKTGRGAYLCPVKECWEIGLKHGRLEHGLRTKLTQDNRERLIRLGEDFCRDRSGD